MGLKRLFAAAALVAAAGCTQAEADYPSQEELYDDGEDRGEAAAEETEVFLRAGGRFLNVEASPTTLLGPEINVARTTGRDRGLRGLAYNQPVNLSFEEGEVSGIVGMSPFRLDVWRDDGALRAEGLVYGQLADLLLDGDRLSVQIGSCGYVLSREGSAPYAYQGMGSCGGPLVPATVRLPAELIRWGDPDLAAALMLLSAGVSTAR